MKTTDGNSKKKRTVKTVTAEDNILTIYKRNTNLTLVCALKGIYDRELDFKAYEAYLDADKETLFATCQELAKMAGVSLMARLSEKATRSAAVNLLELKAKAWRGYRPTHMHLVSIERGMAVYGKKPVKVVKIDKASKVMLGISPEGESSLKGKVRVPFSGKEVDKSEVPFDA